MSTRRVAMIGSFPPPVGGAALVNQMVLDALRARGADAVPFDVSGPALAHSRSLGYHLQRVAANARAGARARRLAGPGNVLYLVPDAGAGAWYSAAIARAAVGFERVVVHHHSCRYIEEQSRPVALLTEWTRTRATHVFLTEGMGEAFRRRYGAVEAFVATNARFVAEEAAEPAASRISGPLRLGHLSNLCADKGFFAVADTFDALCATGTEATLLLAGPVLEEAVGVRIADLVARHGQRVRHLGSVRGEAKRDFYRELDLFLFPTRFPQEAAPLVIYEALAAGVPVLSTDRGVIPELINAQAGAICSRDASFPDFALDWIAQALGDEAARAARTAEIKRAIRAASAVSATQYDALLALLATEARA